MEDTFEEYKEWIVGEIDSDVRHQYKKALAKLKERKPFEDALVSSFFRWMKYSALVNIDTGYHVHL